MGKKTWVFMELFHRGPITPVITGDGGPPCIADVRTEGSELRSFSGYWVPMNGAGGYLKPRSIIGSDERSYP